MISHCFQFVGFPRDESRIVLSLHGLQQICNISPFSTAALFSLNRTSFRYFFQVFRMKRKNFSNFRRRCSFIKSLETTTYKQNNSSCLGYYSIPLRDMFGFRAKIYLVHPWACVNPDRAQWSRIRKNARWDKKF